MDDNMGSNMGKPCIVRARFFGKVQGVGFRNYCQQIAAAKKITGFARNEGNGSVLVEAAGEKNSVEEFIEELCREFEVEKVERQEKAIGQTGKMPLSFSIIR